MFVSSSVCKTFTAGGGGDNKHKLCFRKAGRLCWLCRKCYAIAIVCDSNDQRKSNIDITIANANAIAQRE